MKVLGRMMSTDGSTRDVEVEAQSHATAKIQLKSRVGDDERLLFIRVVQD